MDRTCDNSSDFLCDFVGTADCIRDCAKCVHFLRCDGCAFGKTSLCHARASGLRMRVNAQIINELLAGDSTTFDKFGGFVGNFTFGLGGNDG